MNKETRHKRYKTGELEEKSVQICLNCPMADCNGSQYCSYLRSRLAEMGLITAKKKPANERTCPAKHYVEYDGKLYTLRQMAELCGVSRTAVHKRLRTGWTVKEILQNHREGERKLSVDIHVGGRAKVVEYEGREYTYKELAEICGTPYRTIKGRMYAGWTIKEILQNHREGKKEYAGGERSNLEAD